MASSTEGLKPKNPSPTLPTREGLNVPHPQRSNFAKALPRVLSPLVGRWRQPEGDFLGRWSNLPRSVAKHIIIEGAR